MHVKVKDDGICFLQLFSIYSFETRSLTEPVAHQLTGLAGWQAPGILLPLTPQHWGYRHVLLGPLT